jgi:hypothetical protein
MISTFNRIILNMYSKNELKFIFRYCTLTQNNYTTLLLAFSVVLHLMLLLLILPTTLYTNHLKHVETSYIVLQVDI